MVILILLLSYFLFFEPKVVFEEQCPNTPYSLEVVKHGTGILDWQIAFIHYKIGEKTVASKQLVFFETLGRDFDVVWGTSTNEVGPWIDKSVRLTMTYANFFGDLAKKSVDFDFNSVQF